jgi:branched-chain amino acid transport system ATP-binding protein
MAPTTSDHGEAPVLRLSEVRVRLGGTGAPGGSTIALDGVSFEVGPGQVVSVTGPSGAGKSTVFKAVCGFVRPEAGAITWRGAPLRPRPHRLTTLGLARTLQGVGLYAGLTVLENLLVGSAGIPRVPAVPAGRRAGVAAALLGGIQARPDERELALAYLASMGIAEYADAELAAVPVQLHGRVVLARALVADPELLLIDDPGLDLEPAELARLIRARSSSVVLCTGSRELALAASDRVIVLDHGRVATSGTPAELQAV